MTNYDATPAPMEDPEHIGRAFGEVFDLVDRVVNGVTDEQIEDRLFALFDGSAVPTESSDLAERGHLVGHRDGGGDGPDMAGRVLEVLQASWDEVGRAQAAVIEARCEEERHLEAAAAARRQTETILAGARTQAERLVDEALDQSETILAEARVRAERLVDEAEQQAGRIVAAAQAQTKDTGLVDKWHESLSQFNGCVNEFRGVDKTRVLESKLHSPGHEIMYNLVTVVARTIANPELWALAADCRRARRTAPVQAVTFTRPIIDPDQRKWALGLLPAWLDLLPSWAKAKPRPHVGDAIVWTRGTGRSVEGAEATVQGLLDFCRDVWLGAVEDVNQHQVLLPVVVREDRECFGRVGGLLSASGSGVLASPNVDGNPGADVMDLAPGFDAPARKLAPEMGDMPASIPHGSPEPSLEVWGPERFGE